VFKIKKYLLMTIFSAFLSLPSLPLLARERLNPREYEMLFRDEDTVRCAQYVYHDDKNGEIFCIIRTEENGSIIGSQIFYIPGGNSKDKYFPDRFTIINGIKYSVYNYCKYIVYHTFEDEFIIAF
jgi:hypothetical protein